MMERRHGLRTHQVMVSVAEDGAALGCDGCVDVVGEVLSVAHLPPKRREDTFSTARCGATRKVFSRSVFFSLPPLEFTALPCGVWIGPLKAFFHDEKTAWTFYRHVYRIEKNILLHKRV